MKFSDFPHEKAAMAIFPSRVGFGWIVFDGPLSPVDWGVSAAARSTRGDGKKNERSLNLIEKQIGTFRPPIIVLEEFEGPLSRRGARIRDLCRSIISLAVVEGIDVRVISRAEIRACFADAKAVTRYEVAKVVVSYLPEIRPRLPNKRRAWEAEKPDAALMSAAALLIVHYARPQKIC